MTVDAARREGRDTRPVLLRLLVERYFAAPRHSTAERERFSTLAIRLFDAVDMPTASEIAHGIAGQADMPYGLALHLARGPIEIAAPILRLSPVLDDVTLLALTETSSTQHVAAIAARREVPAALAKRLAAAMHEARGERVSRSPEPATAPPRHLAPEHFLNASPMQRAAILDNLVTRPPLPVSERVPRAAPAMIERLEQAGLRHQPAVFASVLEKALGVSGEVAERIVADESGEAIIVACRVLGVPFDVVSRILFFLNPAIGQSVTRVFGLADLFENLSETSAQHLAASWRTGTRRSAAARPMEDAPSMRSFGAARRGAQQPADSASERRRRG